MENSEHTAVHTCIPCTTFLVFGQLQWRSVYFTTRTPKNGGVISDVLLAGHPREVRTISHPHPTEQPSTAQPLLCATPRDAFCNVASPKQSSAHLTQPLPHCNAICSPQLSCPMHSRSPVQRQRLNTMGTMASDGKTLQTHSDVDVHHPE